MHVNIIADFGDLCGECPLWNPITASLYWTDCAGLKFYSHHLPSGQSRLLRSGLEINGFRRNEPGGFVFTNNSGFWLWNGGEAEPRLIAGEADGQVCRMNDCVADGQGRLLACSWFYDGSDSYRSGRLMRVDPDGIVTILDDGFCLANGLALSPNHAQLYVTDSAARTIYEYDYDERQGAVGRRRTLVSVPKSEGLPDGLRVDSHGFLWSAQWYGSCVVRYDPDGFLERRLAIPAKQVSSLTFGGHGLTTLFVTTAKLSEPMPVMPPGYDPHNGIFGGPLYSVELDIKGLEDLPAQIALPS